MFFSNLLLPYALDIFLLEYKKDEKPQVHSRPPLIQNFKNCNILSTYNLHKGYKVDYGICLNSHEYT
jgi:hypothetical protein